MIFIIVGPMASGKTTISKQLEEEFGLERIVTYTTRPKRAKEKDGVDYNFITEEEFDAMEKLGYFAETTEYNADFGYCRYGSTVESYRGDQNKIIVLNPKGVLTVLKELQKEDVQPIVIWLDINEETRVQRALKRGDKPEEITRRSITDSNDFTYFQWHGRWNLRITGTDMDENTLREYVASKIESPVTGRKKFASYNEEDI